MTSKNSFNTINENYYLSQGGILELKNKLQALRAERLEQIQNLRMLKEQQSDSFSAEDSSYMQTLGKLQTLETDIEKTEHILAHSKLMDKEKRRQKDKVEFGSKVKLKAGGREIEYMIVDSLEADPSRGKISDKSPLGRQLLGKKIRDYIKLRPLRHHKPISLRLVSIK